MKKRIFSVFMALAMVLTMFGVSGNMMKVEASRDETAPVLTSLTLSKSEITTPGQLDITFGIEEDGVGVSDLYALFVRVSDDGKELDSSHNFVISFMGGNNYGMGSSYYYDSTNNILTINSDDLLETGDKTFSMPISSRMIAGTYVCEYVTLKDYNDNETDYRQWQKEKQNADGSWEDYYDSSSNVLITNDEQLKYFNDASNNYSYVPSGITANTTLVIKDEFDVDFEASISNSKILSKIQSMSDDGVALINYTTASHIATKAMFSAIAGTNKTLVFTDGTVQWVFKGSDINSSNIKDIDLLVKINTASATDYGNANNVLKIDFADNGTLPGSARIRMKADYISTLHKLTSAMKLYYINGNNAELVDNNVDYILDGSDHWCQFDVSHNSTYVLSSGTVKITKQSNNSVTKKNITYKVNSNNTATITSEGNKNVRSVVIPNTVKINGKSYKVTEVSSKAFSGCKKLKSITIAKNVNTIGKNAFKNVKKKCLIKVCKKNKKSYKSMVKKIKKSGVKNVRYKFKKVK